MHVIGDFTMTARSSSPRRIATILATSLMLALSIMVGGAQATDIDTDIAVLRALDKVSTRATVLKAPVGRAIEFGRLTIVARRCVTRPPEETPESAVFLDIDKAGPAGLREPVFKGWMFASSPDLSAMEDAVYDVWVLACESSESNASGSSGP